VNAKLENKKLFKSEGGKELTQLSGFANKKYSAFFILENVASSAEFFSDKK